MRQLFLDSNAHHNINPKALKALIDFNSSPAASGHPLAPSYPGREAQSAIELAREKIASLLGAEKASQIVFTSSATHAAQWGLGCFKAIVDRSSTIAISPTEHPSVYKAFKNTGKENTTYRSSDPKYEFDFFAHNKNGKYIEQKHYNQLVSIHVQNETGLIQPIESMDCDYLFSDMTQSLGKLPINLTELDVDMAIFGAHKIGGLSIGILYFKNTDWWQSNGYGSRYFLDRPGTPDTSGIITTVAALEDSLDTLQERTANMIEFRDTLEPG